MWLFRNTCKKSPKPKQTKNQALIRSSSSVNLSQHRLPAALALEPHGAASGSCPSLRRVPHITHGAAASLGDGDDLQRFLVKLVYVGKFQTSSPRGAGTVGAGCPAASRPRGTVCGLCSQYVTRTLHQGTPRAPRAGTRPCPPAASTCDNWESVPAPAGPRTPRLPPELLLGEGLCRNHQLRGPNLHLKLQHLPSCHWSSHDPSAAVTGLLDCCCPLDQPDSDAARSWVLSWDHGTAHTATWGHGASGRVSIRPACWVGALAFRASCW